MNNDKNMNLPAEEQDFKADIITLTDEDGKDHVFELVDTLEVEEGRFVALLPYHDNVEDMLEDDATLVILKEENEEGDDLFLAPVESDDEYEKVSEIFMERLADLFEFDVEEDD